MSDQALSDRDRDVVRRALVAFLLERPVLHREYAALVNFVAEFDRLTEERDALRAERDEAHRLFIKWEVEAATRTVRIARLEEALRQGRDLVNAMDVKMPEQAAVDEDDWIVNYRIQTGPWHRLLGWARGAVSSALSQDTESPPTTSELPTSDDLGITESPEEPA